ncbi:MAG TPA: EamA family transporter [Candidatus Thermoplasmatota archaeon]|nr:EamA family transporter [Candidatus Thermoplasmatota archaeon]
MTTLHPQAPSSAAVKLPRTFLILAALGTVYLTWGSTYLAIRIAVQHIPPLLLAGSRFLAAGLVLYAIVRLRGAARPTWKQWGAATLVGVATFVLSHGLLAWASQHVPSGTAALLSSASPAWIALGGAAGLISGHRPGAVALVGTALGLAGVALAADPASILAGGTSFAAVAALLAGSLAWAVGSVLARWSILPRSSTLSAAMAMLAGGALLLAGALATGEASAIQPRLVPLVAWGALAYLTLFGSIVAYSAYVWLLREDGPRRVSAHSFVNPLVAVLLGAAVAGEALTTTTLAAAALVVAGVALVSLAPGMRQARGKRAEAAAVASRTMRPCTGC